MELQQLKFIRKGEKLSLKELSLRTRMTAEQLSLIERGLVNPSYQTMEKIVAALGRTITII